MEDINKRETPENKSPKKSSQYCWRKCFILMNKKMEKSSKH